MLAESLRTGFIYAYSQQEVLFYIDMTALKMYMRQLLGQATSVLECII